MAIIEQCNQCRAYNSNVGLCTRNWGLPSFDGEVCAGFDDKNIEKTEAVRKTASDIETEEDSKLHVMKTDAVRDRFNTMRNQKPVEESLGMLRSISELKNAAINELRGKWGSAVLFTSVLFLVFVAWIFICAIALVSKTFAGTVLFFVMYYGGGLLFLSVLYYGAFNAFVEAKRNKEALRTSRLFMGFEDSKTYVRVVWQVVVVFWFLFWWSMLFLLPVTFISLFLQLPMLVWMMVFSIPITIISYSYSMVPYICHDHPEMSANEAINYSKMMMQDHKWDLFVLHLSFLGWIILGVLTLYIGFLWIIPYVYATQAQFYEDIKGEMLEQDMI